MLPWHKKPTEVAAVDNATDAGISGVAVLGSGRIVSISQPHIRPIVCGKAGRNVEFGAKISISVKDGYTFVDKIGWDNFSEGSLLIEQCNAYFRRFGCWPERILGDKA